MSIQFYSYLVFSSCFDFFLVQKISGEHWSWGVYTGCPPKKGEKGNPATGDKPHSSTLRKNGKKLLKQILFRKFATNEETINEYFLKKCQN